MLALYATIGHVLLLPSLLHVAHWNYKNYKRKSVSRVLVYVSGALFGLQMTRRHTPITRHIRPMEAIKDTPSTAITGRPKAISGLIKGFGSESHSPGSILRYCLRLSLLSIIPPETIDWIAG